MQTFGWKKEYDSVRNASFIDSEFEGIQKYLLQAAKTSPLLSDFYQKGCTNCESKQVCKYVDTMPPHATGYAYFKAKGLVSQKQPFDP